jgi:hypothetical protein
MAEHWHMRLIPLHWSIEHDIPVWKVNICGSNIANRDWFKFLSDLGQRLEQWKIHIMQEGELLEWLLLLKQQPGHDSLGESRWGQVNKSSSTYLSNWTKYFISQRCEWIHGSHMGWILPILEAPLSFRECNLGGKRYVVWNHLHKYAPLEAKIFT